MGYIRIMKRDGEGIEDYKKALKKLKEAKRAIDVICDLSEDMEDEFSTRSDSHFDEDELVERISKKIMKRM